ncbi:MAG: ribosomal protein S18-alanine N-acetyltransferase [bacterium]|nr:MAG: ribosomal protein S18-alanine N-acetyltransferase [bacterium]
MLSIRPMTDEDLDEVHRIEVLSYDHPWFREQFQTELARGQVSRCLVAVVEEPPDGSRPFPGRVGGRSRPAREVLAGFIMGWLVADELHITNLAVDPARRRSGVAAALLQHITRDAEERGCSWCQLEVRRSNKAARSLYTRWGFREMGVRKGYYQNGEDAIVMGRDLQGTGINGD